MPGSFWFEERGTERYYSIGKKTVKVGKGKNAYTYEETDWKREVPRTKEEYEACEARGFGGDNVYRKGDITKLQQVDEIMCAFMQEPVPDPNADSRLYYLCHEWGYLSLYKLGGSYMAERHVDWIIEKNIELWKKRAEEENDPLLPDRLSMFVRWVFLYKWRFHATG